MDASEDYDILLQDDEAQDEHDEHEDDMTAPPTVDDTMLLETLGMLHHQWKQTNKAKQECLEHTIELEKIQSEMIALANGTRPNHGRMMITLNEKATKEEEIIELKKEESSCKEDIEANLRSVAAELNEEDEVNISSSLRHLLWTLDDNNFTSHLENRRPRTAYASADITPAKEETNCWKNITVFNYFITVFTAISIVIDFLVWYSYLDSPLLFVLCILFLNFLASFLTRCCRLTKPSLCLSVFKMYICLAIIILQIVLKIETTVWKKNSYINTHFRDRSNSTVYLTWVGCE